MKTPGIIALLVKMTPSRRLPCRFMFQPGAGFLN